MKKLIVAMLVFTCFACEDGLLERPKAITVENFYNTPSEAETGIAAIYLPLRSAFGAVYLATHEASTDYFVARDVMLQLSDFEGIEGPNRVALEDIWHSFYLSVRNANLVIKHVANGNELTDVQKAGFTAEARALRALNYFHLVQNWAGVPLRTDQNMDVIELSKSTAGEIYDFILADLQFAENLLPDNVSRAGRLSKWGAKTILAHVYLVLGRYADAATKAAEVIEAGKYSLVAVSAADDFEQVFGAGTVNSNEEIFYLKYNRESPWGFPRYLTGNNFSYLGLPGYYMISGRYEMKFYREWNNADLRKKYGVYDDQNVDGAFEYDDSREDLPNQISSRKFRDRTQQAARNDYPLYRYADLLLLYAEASCEQAGAPTPAGVDKLNMVRRRAYGYSITQPSPVDVNIADYDKASFIRLVFRERGYETHSEGKRWLDLKRASVGKEIIREATGKTIADRHLLWPLPVMELNFNKAIHPVNDQNPGY